MGVKSRSGPRMAELASVLLLSILTAAEAGLLGAGSGAGSCPAFPNRTPSTDLDHVAGCPRYAECCSEFGYCHPKDSWVAGYFRDCNGESNGQALEGGVIREEALEAASNQGQSLVSFEYLGISQEIWESQVTEAIRVISSSSSSSSSSSFSSSSSSSSASSSSSSSSSLSTSSLVAQILAAIQPEIAGAVQTAVASSKGSGNTASIQGGFDSSSFGQDNFGSNQGFSNFDQTTNIDSSNFDSSQQQSQSSFGSTLDSSSFDFGSTSTLGLPLVSSTSRAPPTNFANLASSGAGLGSGASGFGSGGAGFSSSGSGFGGSGLSSSFDSSSSAFDSKSSLSSSSNFDSSSSSSSTSSTSNISDLVALI